MSPLIEIAVIAAGLWILSWLIMILLAKRLPPGLLRDGAEFLPRYAARAIPRDVLLAAWPAETRLLDRLVPPRA